MKRIIAGEQLDAGQLVRLDPGPEPDVMLARSCSVDAGHTCCNVDWLAQPAEVAIGTVSPGTRVVYAVGKTPLSATVYFPPSFTDADKERAWEALRAIYTDVLEREQARK